MNSYAAYKLSVSVNYDNNVDLPTEGKPIIQTLALPTLYTSKPSDFPPAKFLILYDNI